jgi:hypothetical protein
MHSDNHLLRFTTKISFLYSSLLILFVPYIIFFFDGFAGYLMNPLWNHRIFQINLVISTPGLLIVGFILSIEFKKIHRIIGILSILVSIGYLLVLFWAIFLNPGT